MRPDDLKKLREQRLTLIEELRSFTAAAQDRASKNEGILTAEDQEEHKRRGDEIISLTERLRLEADTEKLSSLNAESMLRVGDENEPATLEEFRSSRYAGLAWKPEQAAIRETDVRKAFYQWLAQGREGMEYEEHRVLSKAASGGGFLVPTDLGDLIVRALRFLPGGVGALARSVVTSNGDTIQIPLNLTHGTAAWIAESGSYTPSDETLTQGTISAYKAGTKIIVSEELLTDSAFDLSSFITTEFGERIGALAESAYISGDGSGKPTGILDAASAVTVSTLPAGYVTTLAWGGLATAIFSVPAQYRANMQMLVSDSLFIKLLGTTDSTGAPLWSGSVATGAPDRFAGIPVYSHPNLAAVGANSKSAIVGDFSRGYMIRRVDSIYMQRQNELHSDSGQVGFRAYLRLDGKVTLADSLRIVAFAAT